MRKQFIQRRDSGLQDDGLGAETEEEAQELCPWATIVECDGGWWAFEDMRDLRIWQNQE